ncbi:two component transcriptional regulator, winged helix family [Candidatus Thiomargarita nelsonii]|uniref:Phosphate regulon transcriptional regulatory protein PhoB n=1 Tax=Candidatus Thiomargarita nelsonii TaxID=1003181 RepID=A0A0A6P0J2_9GAMM|nr:two component transcriptional regulator, winged helix family [Candidatus Thiomargarita nelsonii]
MTKQPILIVEDEIKIAQLLHDYLTKADYTVSCLEQGDKVIPYVKQTPPALILLDIMLPEMDGMTVCREIRKFSTVPIIMITAKVEEIDRLLGLELGADDYISKPFSPREVVARVKAVLRRIDQKPQEAGKLVVGTITLDENTYQVKIEDHILKLTPSEFVLLKVLLSHPNRVFSRQALLTQARDYDFEGYERTIDSHIKNLRKKLATRLPKQEIISTVYGIGYKLKYPW